MVNIDYGDLVRLNRLLWEKGTGYHLAFRDSTTACLEPPGSCCLTPKKTQDALGCIQAYYQDKGLEVRWGEDGLYLTLEKIPGQ